MTQIKYSKQKATLGVFSLHYIVSLLDEKQLKENLECETCEVRVRNPELWETGKNGSKKGIAQLKVALGPLTNVLMCQECYDSHDPKMIQHVLQLKNQYGKVV